MISKLDFPSTNRSGILFVFSLVTIDWLWKSDERNPLNLNYNIFRWIIYGVLLYLIVGHLEIIDMNQFIYFQF